eukprot:TRINITY_DN2486_c0_g1_i1.p1 TRINITY_DN2486_c0_g1~~TRINITY_DN2486_c0_g1_i1.p1  ORF type:complete len:149 (-),score=39.81 TRINITY_DN2486_c0_g1_i1:85-531(-)
MKRKREEITIENLTTHSMRRILKKKPSSPIIDLCSSEEADMEFDLLDSKLFHGAHGGGGERDPCYFSVVFQEEGICTERNVKYLCAEHCDFCWRVRWERPVSRMGIEWLLCGDDDLFMPEKSVLRESESDDMFDDREYGDDFLEYFNC